VFLLPSLLVGVLLAVVLGGRPSRVLEVRFRLAPLVPAALLLQIVVFSQLGSELAEELRRALHLGSYGLLIAFAIANLRLPTLLPVVIGTLLNATVILANGGRMPVSDSAAAAARLDAGGGGSVSPAAERLFPLGDIFALPSSFPLGNVFSVGDVLIGAGIAAFLVVTSLEAGNRGGLAFRRLLEPLRARPYRRLVAGRLVSQVGDWVTLAALIGWIYGETHSPGHVALLLIVRLAPPILGGGLAALVVDRLPKRRVLVAVELARGLTVAGALMGVLADERTAVVAVVALSGLLAAFSGTTLPALVPSLVDNERLPAANAGLSVSKDIGMVLGGSGAGIALSSVGTAPALVLDLATFVLAAGFYLALPKAAGDSPGRRPGDPGGVRYLLVRPRLMLLVCAFAAATLATGLTNASLPSFLGGQLELGPSGYGYGLAALGVGLTCGGVLVGLARVGQSANRWIGLGLALMAALFFVLAASEHAPTALLLLAAIGFLDATTDVLFDTVIQREADSRYLGSVFGVASALMMTTMVAGFLAAPLAQRLLGASQSIVLAGAVLGLAGFAALLGMRWPAARPNELYVLFVPAATGYSLVERAGEPPAAGTEIVSEGRRFLVAKLGRSPFPDRAVRCAYLQEQPSPA
jgi:predicted MFS family arabinose efflux permease